MSSNRKLTYPRVVPVAAEHLGFSGPLVFGRVFEHVLREGPATAHGSVVRSWRSGADDKEGGEVAG